MQSRAAMTSRVELRNMSMSVLLALWGCSRLGWQFEGSLPTSRLTRFDFSRARRTHQRLRTRVVWFQLGEPAERRHASEPFGRHKFPAVLQKQADSENACRASTARRCKRAGQRLLALPGCVVSNKLTVDR